MSIFDFFMDNGQAKDILYQMQLQIYDIFKSQDPELFDVVFEIEGKKIYADKLRLSAVSSTLKSMISDRWTSKNKPVKIKDYKFKDFQRFLIFIYSGECTLTNQNILTMLDMAEFYHVNQLKKFCGRFLSEKKINFENVFQFLEISVKYPNMARIKSRLHDFISKNFINFIKCDGFLKANKFAVEGFLILQPIFKQEEVFTAVYEWAEHQIVITQEVSNEENLNKNDAIKSEISDFMQYFEFKKMNLNFFVEYVVKRGFLFSYHELSDIWKSVHSNVKVKVTNSNGASVFGILPGASEVVEIIKSLKNCQSDLHRKRCTIYWKTECKVPSTPVHLKKRDFVQWYLIFLPDGNIAVTPDWNVSENDYLIAEMAEIDDKNCSFALGSKIDIV